MLTYEFLQMQRNPQTLLRKSLDRRGSVQRLPSMAPMFGRLLRYQLLLNSNDRSTVDILEPRSLCYGASLLNLTTWSKSRVVISQDLVSVIVNLECVLLIASSRKLFNKDLRTQTYCPFLGRRL